MSPGIVYPDPTNYGCDSTAIDAGSELDLCIDGVDLTSAKWLDLRALSGTCSATPDPLIGACLLDGEVLPCDYGSVSPDSRGWCFYLAMYL